MLCRSAALAAGVLSLTGIAAETETVYLSGRGADDAVAWDFFCTAGRNRGTWSKIRVPSCWEQEGFGTYQYGIELRSKKSAPPLATEQGKYRLQFAVPAAWRGFPPRFPPPTKSSRPRPKNAQGIASSTNVVIGSPVECR